MNYDIYYNTLNITREATINDIKKAYRQLSIKYHPDKNNNGNSSQFNRINEAYSKLINDYDIIKLNDKNTSQELLLSKSSGTATNAVNNNDMLYKYGTTIMNNNYEDIIINLSLIYSEAYSGCNKPIIVDRKIITNNFCINEKETLYIQIPKGIDNNEIITLHNKGNMYINNGITNNSNIKIIIVLKPHEYFERNGLDIIFIKTITLKEALIGFSFVLNHINNKNYNITCSEIIHFNYEKIKNNMGFMRDNFIGNLIIKFIIVFPSAISQEAKQQLEKLL